MFDTAKSGAVEMQKIALKAATEAASAAAEATVQAVMRTLSRENASRGRRATPKGAKPLVGQRARKDASTSASNRKPTGGYARRLSVF